MIDLGLKAALYGGGALLALSAVAGFAHHERGIGYAKAKAEEAVSIAGRQTVVITRQAEVLAKNDSKDEKAKEVDHETQDRLSVAQLAADRALAVNGSLRATLDGIRADAMRETTTRASLAAQVAAAADSLSECGGEYQSLGKAHDGLSIQVTGLQALAENEQHGAR